MQKVLTVRANKPSESWPKALTVLGIFKYGLDKRFKEVRRDLKDEVKQLWEIIWIQLILLKELGWVGGQFESKIICWKLFQTGLFCLLLCPSRTRLNQRLLLSKLRTGPGNPCLPKWKQNGDIFALSLTQESSIKCKLEYGTKLKEICLIYYILEVKPTRVKYV